ncbi:hypothetical protein [Gluconobacter oxydans]|uniref:Phage associated protein n=1 Tax=Gluconobacter oxydans NBRC 3293 TaxID=1315969 RepID=A0A829WZI3_GLUOY|nr:hypothetical protein [Gluconobacter oxydans]GEM16037.1 hypothetical protein NBRC3293_0534 [Gluconobacter oxydans NBRC 3293]
MVSQTDGTQADLPLVSTQSLMDALSITDGNASGPLTDILLRASQAVASYIGRPLLIADREEKIRIRPGDIQLSLKMAVWPVTGITAVLRDGNPLPVPQDGWDYDVTCGLLYPSEGQFWSAGRYIVQYRAGWVAPDQTDVDGSAIPSTVPADVGSAVLITARALYHGRDRDPLLKSESEQGVGSSSWATPDATSGGLPADATALLGRYLPGGFS